MAFAEMQKQIDLLWTAVASGGVAIVFLTILYFRQ